MRAVQFQGQHFVPASALRNRQVEDAKQEQKLCTDQINRAKFDSNINAKHFMERLAAVNHMLDTQQAKPFEGREIDSAVKEEEEIRKDLIESCQSNRVLRHAPSGAVPQLIRWEQQNKTKLLYWKGLRLRLHASGVDFGTTANDVANFEPYRPRETTHDQNMDNTVVPVKEYHEVPEKTWKPADEMKPVEEGFSKMFFKLKKQVKDLTGTAPKNKQEAEKLLSERGIDINKE